MDFGVSFPTYVRAWEDVKRAEDYGFTHAWFDDSHMCYSDIFCTMTLAAEHTSRIKLGTFVIIAGNRAAPTVATAMATLNELAPGRVIFGIGTGFSARNVMGMPAQPLSVVKEDVAVFRDLAAGGEAEYREEDRVRDIRFLHPEMGFINVRDPIPVYVAANAPKAIKTVGEIKAEGWIVVTNDPGFVRHGLAEIKTAGHPGNPLDVVALVGACVLRPGEKLMSPRVIERLGPWALLALHTIWTPEEIPVGPFAPPALYDLAKRYRDECIMKMATPLEKRFQEIHLGHLIFVKPQERRFITEELITATSCVGSGAEIIERIRALEQAGATSVVFRITSTDARETISEIGREIVAKY
ncbi:MAG TPA: LLM class flavin-dependent oxidoreductase [Candidatus Binataceae bacterium]|nr:LLM class flavin-dependent oxidoreductase [Candidatus Binataceae bacterium]